MQRGACLLDAAAAKLLLHEGLHATDSQLLQLTVRPMDWDSELSMLIDLESRSKARLQQ